MNRESLNLLTIGSLKEVLLILEGLFSRLLVLVLESIMVFLIIKFCMSIISGRLMRGKLKRLLLLLLLISFMRIVYAVWKKGERFRG